MFKCTCAYCLDPFVGRTKYTRFCTASHRQLFYRNGRESKYGPKHTPPKLRAASKPAGSNISCLECNTEFISRRKTQNFCSDECRITFNSKKRFFKVDQNLYHECVCYYTGTRFASNDPDKKFINPDARNRFYRNRYKQEDVIKSLTFKNHWFDPEDNHVSRVFVDCTFIECDFSGCNLDSARFANCVIKDSEFHRATFIKTDFIDCVFFGVNDFTEVTVKSVKFLPQYDPENVRFTIGENR